MYTASRIKPSRWPKTTCTRAFLITAILQASIVTVLEAYVFGKWEAFLRPNAVQVPSSRVIPTFLALLVFASIYSLIFIYDGLYRRSSIQITVACILNIGIIVYSAIQPGKIHTSVISIANSRDALRQPLVDLSMDMWGDVKVVLTILPCLIGALTLVMFFLAWKIHGEFEWEVYRAIAGDTGMKRRFVAYQVYILLLKVDFFFIIGYITQLTAQVLDIGGVEFIATLCAVPAILAVLILSHLWTRRENKPGTMCTIALLMAVLGYFVYKMIVMYTWKDVHFMYEAGWTMLNIFASASIALLFCTVVNSIVCFCNFGKGLMMYLVPNEKEENLMSYEPSMLAYNPPVVRRLSLD